MEAATLEFLFDLPRPFSASLMGFAVRVGSRFLEQNKRMDEVQQQIDAVKHNQVVIKNHLFGLSLMRTVDRNVSNTNYDVDVLFWPVNQDLEHPNDAPRTKQQLLEMSELQADELLAFYRQVFVGDRLAKLCFFLQFLGRSDVNVWEPFDTEDMDRQMDQAEDGSDK